MQSVWHQRCSILLLMWLPPNKASNLKFPVVPRTKRFHYIKGPQCAGVYFFGVVFFFHNSHSSMTQTMSQSHHTIVWKGKQHIKQSSIFLSMITAYLERLRGFPNVTWIRGVLGKSQRQRRESRTMSHLTKSLGFQKEKEKSSNFSI